MINIDNTSWKPFKQVERSDGSWSNYCIDEDYYIVAVITDADGNILSEVETGECGCPRCIN